MLDMAKDILWLLKNGERDQNELSFFIYTELQKESMVICKESNQNKITVLTSDGALGLKDIRDRRSNIIEHCENVTCKALVKWVIYTAAMNRCHSTIGFNIHGAGNSKFKSTARLQSGKHTIELINIPLAQVRQRTVCRWPTKSWTGINCATDASTWRLQY